MPRTKPAYPPEFRREAIRLVSASGEDHPIPRISTELGVSVETLRNWVKQEVALTRFRGSSENLMNQIQVPAG